MANARKSKVRDANPQDWLFLNPDGPSPLGLAFGVLRKTYGGRINSAAEFGRCKLQPIAPPGDAAASPWRVAEMAFRRQTDQPATLSFRRLETRPTVPQDHPLDTALALYRWATPWARPKEFERVMVLRMARAEAFLDANWRAIMRLPKYVMAVSTDPDGCAVLTEAKVQRALAQRPVKLSAEDRATREQRGPNFSFMGRPARADLLGARRCPD